MSSINEALELADEIREAIRTDREELARELRRAERLDSFDLYEEMGRVAAVDHAAWLDRLLDALAHIERGEHLQ